MEKRMVYSRIIILGCFLLLGFLFYNSKYSNEGILKNVTERKGYTLSQMENKEMVELYIKPEWIPYNNKKEQKFDIKLAEKHNTNIILVQVWNRGEDIYFSFDTTYNLNFYNGNFMYNGIFNEDGTFTSGGLYDDFYLYNKNGENIDLGQSGRGPNSAFGFAVEPKNYDLIKDGFYIEYKGFYLYKYSKN